MHAGNNPAVFKNSTELAEAFFITLLNAWIQQFLTRQSAHPRTVVTT